MKSEKHQKAIRVLLSTTCFTAYLFFFAAMLADAFNTSLYHVIFG